jgi:hypothetical protein
MGNELEGVFRTLDEMPPAGPPQKGMTLPDEFAANLIELLKVWWTQPATVGLP